MKAAADSLRAGAFDAWPEAALVFDADGGLEAVNEAAEDLFGQALALLQRGPLRETLPAGAPLAALLDRCLAAAGPVRERGVEVDLPGRAPLAVDAAATPLGEGTVLLTLRPRPAPSGVDRGADPAGL
ncbi:MAG: PAS domain-containing protein, partial [Caulobacteraceae bacterium]|nr:PAS domain-containing protein [Caulobacteraceae bacterium]